MKAVSEIYHYEDVKGVFEVGFDIFNTEQTERLIPFIEEDKEIMSVQLIRVHGWRSGLRIRIDPKNTYCSEDYVSSLISKLINTPEIVEKIERKNQICLVEQIGERLDQFYKEDTENRAALCLLVDPTENKGVKAIITGDTHKIIKGLLSALSGDNPLSKALIDEFTQTMKL